MITGLATAVVSLVFWVILSGFSWPPPPDPYDRVRYTDEVQAFLKRYPDADVGSSPSGCHQEICSPFAGVSLKYWSPNPEGTAWLSASIPDSGYESPTFTAWCNLAGDTVSRVTISGQRINMTEFFSKGQCPPSN
jgi:hypothetical protein